MFLNLSVLVLFSTLMTLDKDARPLHPGAALLTWRWGGVVRVRVALAAVLHLEAGKVPRHADDAVRLVQKYVGQHAPVAVHHDHLSVRSAKQHLERGKKKKEKKG